MALFHFTLLALSYFTIESAAQAEDPVADFCRRFGHQTTVIDRQLYIDGGIVNWNPLSSNPTNYSSKYSIGDQHLAPTNLVQTHGFSIKLSMLIMAKGFPNYTQIFRRTVQFPMFLVGFCGLTIPTSCSTNGAVNSRRTRKTRHSMSMTPFTTPGIRLQ